MALVFGIILCLGLATLSAWQIVLFIKSIKNRRKKVDTQEKEDISGK